MACKVLWWILPADQTRPDPTRDLCQWPERRGRSCISGSRRQCVPNGAALARPGLANEEVQRHTVIWDGVLLTSKTHTRGCWSRRERRGVCIYLYIFIFLHSSTNAQACQKKAYKPTSAVCKRTWLLTPYSLHTLQHFWENRLKKKDAVNYE